MTLDYNASAKRWQRYGEEYLTEGRNMYFQGINFAIQFAIFLMGFNVLWFQVNQNPLSNILKILITVNLASLTISLIMGILCILKFHEFMNRAGEHYQRMSEKMYEYILDTNKSSGSKYPEYLLEDKDFQYESKPWQFNLALYTLSLGTILTFTISLILLWS